MRRALRYFIVGVHLFFLCTFLFGSSSPKKKQRIVVHAARIKPQPKPQMPAKTQELKKAAPAAPKKQAAPPKPVAKKPAPVKKPATKKEKKAPIVSSKLAKQLEESIAKIDEKPDNFKAERPSAKTKAKKNVTPIALDWVENEQMLISSGEIKELLVLELKNSLHLPEFGEVTMRLVLRNDGSVASVKVMKSASKKNSDYLEKELPKHSFPFVSSLGLKDKERDFVITFCNEQ
jgi:hypothetical protein